MATFSLNTTIKISAAISVVGANPSYSVPANSYAIVNCYSVSTGGWAILVDGNTAFLHVLGDPNTFVFYVGPGQTVALSGAAAGSSITGVQFLNSP